MGTFEQKAKGKTTITSKNNGILSTVVKRNEKMYSFVITQIERIANTVDFSNHSERRKLCGKNRFAQKGN